VKQLYPVQRHHADTLVASLKQRRAALDASETGCGKTLVGVHIALELGLPVVVICPKALVPAWKAELTAHEVEATVVNYEKLRAGNTPLGRFTQRKWAWSIPENTLLIWDEVQKCMGMTSQNGKMLVAAKPFVNLALSATAAEDPTEMRALGFVLGLHNLTDFYSWLKRHGCKPNPWGAMEFKGSKEVLAKIHATLFGEGRGSRLTHEDLSEHFTETQIITTPLDFGNEDIPKLYAEMDAEVETLKEEMADDSTNPAAKALIAQLRARQQVELLKVPTMVDTAEDLLREGRSVALFVNFDATLHALCERMQTRCKVHGGQLPGERSQAIREFQDNTSRIIVCNIAAGGVGVSLHDVHGGHPRAALISPSWNAKELLQVVGRVHRAGGKTPSLQRILFAAGTIEETVEKALREKMKNIETINEGDGLTAATPEDSVEKQNMPAEPPSLCSGLSNPQQAAPTPEPASAEVDHAARAHARYSPSSLTYREICPNWENDEDPEKDTSAADRGTRIHECIEMEDLTKLDGEDYLVAEMCLNYTEGLKQPGTIVLKEQRLNVLDQYGTVDWIGIRGSHADVVDYKTGRRSVPDAEINAQLWAYMLGVWDRFPQVDTIEGHLLLPRRDEVSRHVFSRGADYERIKLRISTIIARAEAKEIFNATPKGCEFCGKKGSCPALASVALTIAATEKLAENAEGTAESLGLDVNDPATIGRLLTTASIVEKWAVKVRDEALRLALYEGVEIPGYEKTERSAPRAVTSAFGAWEAVKHVMTAENFMASVSRISITELEKNFAATAEKGKKGRSKQMLENLLRDAGVLKEEGSITYLRAVKN